MWPMPQSAHAVPRGGRQDQQGQERLKRHARDLVLVGGAVPPAGKEIANPACCDGHIIRQPRPGLIGVDAGNRLEQIVGKILATNILNGVDQLLDAQVGRVNRGLSPGKKSDMVTELGAIAGRRLGLGWLPSRRRRPEQIKLRLRCRERGAAGDWRNPRFQNGRAEARREIRLARNSADAVREDRFPVVRARAATRRSSSRY